MEMTEIRKETFGSVQQVNEVLNDLAKQAEDILGYNPLSVALAKANSGIELTPLQTTLKDLDIEIMRCADVKTYMIERQIEHTQERMAAWLKEFSATGEPTRYNRFDGPAWVRVKISEYKQPVPEFVLAKAVQVKTAFPECEVWIESLENHPDPFLSVGIPDTQYTWSEPKEHYFIEVWAEPRFEGAVR